MNFLHYCGTKKTLNYLEKSLVMEIAGKTYNLSQLRRLTILKPKKNNFSAEIKNKVRQQAIQRSHNSSQAQFSAKK
jgi:hypothetical protein